MKKSLLKIRRIYARYSYFFRYNWLKFIKTCVFFLEQKTCFHFNFQYTLTSKWKWN